VAAARNIGHLGGSSSNAYWTRAITTHTQHWNERDSQTSQDIVRGLIYGLGISHNDTMLTMIRDMPAAPPHAHAAASWWLEHSQPIVHSATQQLPDQSGQRCGGPVI
jgi:hypothetical protein